MSFSTNHVHDSIPQEGNVSSYDELYTKRILVVDDEPQLQIMMRDILQRAGYSSVHIAGSVHQALGEVSVWNPEVCLLDVMLPDGDGFDLLTRIRRTSQVPVLFLSARDQDEDRLRGLGLGADDYVTKPFLPQELLLRLRAVLRRSYPVSVNSTESQTAEPEHDVLELGNVVVDFSTGVVVCGEKSTPLTATEIALLHVLRENRGIIVTSDTLMERVWGSSFGYENSLMVHIHRLRDKIEDGSESKKWILTARGLGYRLARA